jgi:TonB family protein
VKFIVFLFVLAGTICLAQSNSETAPVQASAETPQAGVVLTKLSPPIYPPLARQARIMGDVKLKLSIRPDGSVESAEVVSGHPLLKQAALESAQKSLFGCNECDSQGNTYFVTYTFAIGDKCENYGPKCEKLETRPAIVTQSAGYVTITVPPLCTCDPRGVITKLRFRSARCLYLWRCGSRIIQVE